MSAWSVEGCQGESEAQDFCFCELAEGEVPVDIFVGSTVGGIEDVHGDEAGGQEGEEGISLAGIFEVSLRKYACD